MANNSCNLIYRNGTSLAGGPLAGARGCSVGVYPLEHQQGRLVPVLYGEGRCDETRALILSYIVGVLPFEQKPPILSSEEFKKRLEAAYQELGVLGLSHDDPKLDNFLLVDDRITLVDLESVADPGPDLEHVMSSYVLHVMDQYDSFLKRQA